MTVLIGTTEWEPRHSHLRPRLLNLYGSKELFAVWPEPVVTAAKIGARGRNERLPVSIRFLFLDNDRDGRKHARVVQQEEH